MKSILALAFLLVSSAAHAETFYFVNGKLSDAMGAEDASTKDPKAVVLKVQANRVTRSNSTGNLKKSDDASVADLKQALSALK